jgi:hypothetical protein
MDEIAKAPISYDERSTAVEEHVVGFEVAMDEAVRVSISHRVGHNGTQEGDLSPIAPKSSAGDVRADRLLEDWHDVKPVGAGQILTMARNDIRMGHLPDRENLTLEPHFHLRMGGPLAVQPLGGPLTASRHCRVAFDDANSVDDTQAACSNRLASNLLKAKLPWKKERGAKSLQCSHHHRLHSC